MAKRLIVCSDGTWNTRDKGKPTNVEKMAQAIHPAAHDGTEQVVFYEKGVGTNWGLDRWLGGAFGAGLSRNVEDAYRFLVDNYAEEDEVYFFGFSRGAFTARSTVGLIRKCHLLRKEHSHRFPEAYAIYRKRDDPKLPPNQRGPDSDEAKAFRERYCTPIKVTCLGVWDTVGALGIPGHLGGTFLGKMINRDFQFHDVKISSTVVRNAYQALAIDEKRAPFEPAIWWRERNTEQALEQAWFPGGHSDVGGGSVTWDEGEKTGSLADIPFAWMVERAKRHGLGFDDEYLARRVKPNLHARIGNSRTGIYRLAPPYVRPLVAMPRDRTLKELLAQRTKDRPGEDPVTQPPVLEWPQVVHESARQRYAEDAKYRPKNLVAFLAGEKSAE
ncbi:MAG: DUF2235 domain-containing protein [Chloroflexi bacterium]|nr:DUF2235 domain-containing protein [Chloroflexota bacterium]